MIPIYKHCLITDAHLRYSKMNKYWFKESLGHDVEDSTRYFKGAMEHAGFKWYSTVQCSTVSLSG